MVEQARINYTAIADALGGRPSGPRPNVIHFGPDVSQSTFQVVNTVNDPDRVDVNFHSMVHGELSRETLRAVAIGDIFVDPKEGTVIFSTSDAQLDINKAGTGHKRPVGNNPIPTQ